MSGSYNLGTAAGRIVIDGSAAKLGFGVAEAAADQFFQLVKDKLDIVRNVGATVLASSTAAAGGFAVATNSAANFEQRLSAIKAVSGASSEEMKQISVAALQIGKDTQFSATQAAQAFEELIKAGVSVKDSLEGGAAATANLAAAGEIDLPRAAEIAANAMNNFHLTGKQMPEIADLVAGAANASAIGVEEFAQSLSQVGAVANLTGVSFKDTAVAIAEMGNAGIKGSDAGTSLKTVLMNLIPQTDQQISLFQEMGLQTFSADKAMQAMAKAGIPAMGSSMDETRQAVSKYLEETQGIPNDTAKMGTAVDKWLQTNGVMQNAFFDTSGKAKNLSEIQQVLQNATKDMTKEQKLANLQILFGSDAIRGAAVMADNGAAGYDKLATAMGKVTATDVAATRMDNLKGSIEQLKGSMETLMIQIGNVFLPIAKKVVDAVTAIVNWFINVNDRAKNFFVTLGAVGTALGMLVGGLITVGSFLAPFILKWLAFKVVKTIIAGVKTEILLMNVAVAEGAGPLTIMMGLFGRMKLAVEGLVARMALLVLGAQRVAAVIAFMSGPWGIVIAVIAAVVAAMVVLYNTWQPFKDIVDSVAKAIQNGLKVAFDWLVTGIQNAAKASQPFFEWLGGVGLTAINGVKDGIDRLVEGFNGITSGADPASKIMNDLGKNAHDVWDAMKMLWDVIKNSLLPAFVDMGGQIGGAFLKSWGDIANMIATQVWPALQQLGQVIGAALRPALQALMDAWKNLMPAFKQVADLVTNTVWPAIVKLWEALGPIIVVILQVVGAVVGGLIIALIYVVAFILGKVVPAIIGFLIPVLTFLIDVITKVALWVIQYLITPFIQFITFLIGTVIPAVVSFIAMLVNGFITGFNFIVDVIKNVVKWFQDIFKSIGDTFKGGADTATGMWDGVAQFFKGIWDAIVTGVTGFVTFFVNAWNGLVTFLKPVIDVYIAMFRAFGAIFDFLMAVINYVVLWIIFIFQQLGAFLNTILTNIGNFFVTVWNNIVNVITTVLTNVWNFIVTVWNAIWAFLQPIIQGIVDFVVEHWNNLVNNVSAALNFIWSVITNVWNAIWGFLQPIIQGIVDFIVERWNNLVNNITGALNFIWGIISGVWNNIVGFLGPIMSNIWNTISGAWNNVMGFLGGIASRIWTTVTDAWNNVVNWLGGIGSRIMGAIGDLGSLLWNAGRDLINGFLGGLKSMWDGVTGFFQDLTSHIPKVKGPPEKDKTLLRDAGQLIMQSLVDGLHSGVGDVYSLLSDLNTTIPLSLSAVMDPNLSKTLALRPESYIHNSQPIVNVAAPKVELTPTYNVTAKIGDKDITDMVDTRVTEHFDDAAQLISTGVLD